MALVTVNYDKEKDGIFVRVRYEETTLAQINVMKTVDKRVDDKEFAELIFKFMLHKDPHLGQYLYECCIDQEDYAELDSKIADWVLRK